MQPFDSRPWSLDPAPILTRGPAGSPDADVVGDPNIVWDETVGTWRMFYFAQGSGGDSTCHALARGPDDIGPGSWQKKGRLELTNHAALALDINWHKWWIVQDAARPHRAARIEGRYWALFVSRQPETLSVAHSRKVIQVACAPLLCGPWTVVPAPILAPPPGDEIDGLNCDTPTAYWFAARDEVLIFYKAYPRHAQAAQPAAPFGSAQVAALWRPGESQARRLGVTLRPRAGSWGAGWIGGMQIFPAAGGGWLGLLNASRTAPESLSLREPAPSMGGWARTAAAFPDRGWELDTARSPFLSPETTTPEMVAAGVQVNFWRHHLLATPGGAARIFFNSGSYGREQMYSLVSSA